MSRNILIFLGLLAFANAQSDITFTLFGTDFSDCDDTSACDLFVVIMCASSTSDWKECGRTSKLQDDNYPVWDESFTFRHEPGTSQRWRFDLIDADLLFDDKIATFDVIVDTYNENIGNLHQLKLTGDNAGTLWIHRRFGTGGKA